MKQSHTNVFTSFCLLFYFLSYGLFSFAQINPEVDEIFRPEELSTVYLKMSDDDKTYLLASENAESNTYLKASFRFINSQMDTTLILPVGVRLRGNTSRNHPKKSFKIKFKEFDGKKFFGLKKFNLKANNNDPSQMREHFALHLYREMDVAAARTHYAKVFLNGEYMGLYLNVEQLDDEFLDSRFDTEDGNLYKCSYGANLTPSNDVYNDEIFELKTQEKANDRSILENFITILNETSDTDFATEIEKILSVETYIKQIAVEAVIGHWDGYSYNQNNYYLFENPTNQKMEFMPYDLDNTFGIDWLGKDWAERDILNWYHPFDQRPLTKRILAVDQFHEKYIEAIKTLTKKLFNENYLFPKFEARYNMLHSAIKDDNYFALTFGFTENDFIQSLTQSVADHAPYGLEPYVRTRSQKCSEQLQGTSLSIQPTYAETLSVYPSVNNGEFIHFSKSNHTVSKLNVQVYNTTGQSMKFSNTNSENKSTLYFKEKLVSGVYVLCVGDDRRKFIVR